MLALTLTQPWAFAVRHLGKPVENRDWAPPSSLIGQRFCIHAGKYEPKSPARLHAEVGSTLESLEAEGLLAPWTLDKELGQAIFSQSGAIVLVATLDRVSRKGSGDPIERSPWRSDTEYGWVLRDVTPIEPVPLRGMQKLWTVPVATADIVRERYQAALVRKVA